MIPEKRVIRPCGYVNCRMADSFGSKSLLRVEFTAEGDDEDAAEKELLSLLELFKLENGLTLREALGIKLVAVEYDWDFTGYSNGIQMLSTSELKGGN